MSVCLCICPFILYIAISICLYVTLSLSLSLSLSMSLSFLLSLSCKGILLLMYGLYVCRHCRKCIKIQKQARPYMAISGTGVHTRHEICDSSLIRYLCALLSMYMYTQDGINALLAAALASLAISIQPAKRRLVMTLFLGARASGALLKSLDARHMLRLSPRTVLVIYICNVAVICHSALRHPECLPPSYYRLVWNSSGFGIDYCPAQNTTFA